MLEGGPKTGDLNQNLRWSTPIRPFLHETQGQARKKTFFKNHGQSDAQRCPFPIGWLMNRGVFGW